MALPDDIDVDKLTEAALGIMWLTVHDSHTAPRVWKGIDWDVLDLMHERGWISDPKNKNKSVLLTETGRDLAQEFLQKYFGEA